jgi:bifunctional oligoribonuclease and PAP phosphatase NrnA
VKVRRSTEVLPAEQTVGEPTRPRAERSDQRTHKPVRLTSIPRRSIASSKNRELSARTERIGLPHLSEVLSSKSIAPLKPADAYTPPEALLKELEGAKKILVIGHVPPDGDCVGAALGLARMLRAHSKEAHACIDDELPGNVRRLDPKKEIRRASELDDDYDLVVLVDVAATDRLGGAAAAVAKAKRIAIIDHHKERATHQSLGVDPSVPLTAWYDDANSATMLVAAAAQRLSERSKKKISPEAWANIGLPLALGMYTDTAGFTREGTLSKSQRVYKYMLEKYLDGDNRRVRNVLRFELPTAAKRLLAAIHATYDQQNGYAFLRASKETIAEACRLAPNASANDIRGYLLQQIDNVVRRYPLSVLLWENDGEVLASTRSKKQGPALELANAISTALGGSGNGHPHMAGAKSPCTLDQANAFVEEWLSHQVLY